MAQTTFHEEYEISNKHPIFQKLKASDNEVYQMLVQHSELFHEHFKKKGINGWSRMHDPLTLAVASGKDFVTFHKSKVSMNDKGQIKLDNNGLEIKWSDPISKRKEFMLFLEKTLFD